MNRYLLMTVVLAVAGFGIAVFLTREEAPDLKESIARSLEAVKLEQEIVTEALPKKAVTGEFPVPSSSGPWPKAVTQELNYAFGRMQLGTTKSHSFTIRNEGEAELQLTAGTTTCKCTEFDFDPSEDVELKSVVVKPGESIDLIIRWKSGENVDRVVFCIMAEIGPIRRGWTGQLVDFFPQRGNLFPRLAQGVGQLLVLSDGLGELALRVEQPLLEGADALRCVLETPTECYQLLLRRLGQVTKLRDLGLVRTQAPFVFGLVDDPTS